MEPEMLGRGHALKATAAIFCNGVSPRGLAGSGEFAA